jgi:beta-lactamase superfamily II metal-dependent hydrolase
MTPELELVASSTLGSLLGMRHAFEPDHLAAVSTLVTGERSSGKAAWLGACWGVGHTLTLMAAGAVLVVLRAEMPAFADDVFELCVVLLLLGFGVRAIRQAAGEAPPDASHLHMHAVGIAHVHVGRWAFAKRPLLVGAVHGLAGSGALTAVVIATLPTTAARLTYLAVFGAGSIVGMAALSGVLGWPLARFGGRRAVTRGVSVAVGSISIALGLYWGYPLIGRFTTVSAAQRPDPKSLSIYLVDVEGGNATLFVAPSGQSVLMDTGNGGAAAARDVGRIMAAVKDAGVTRIDHLITTHWHGDHFGGMSELAARIPIREFIDHGPTVQPQPASTEFLAKAYPLLYGKAKHTVAQPGDRIAIDGLDWRVVTSGGRVTKTPLSGAGRPNPYCAGFTPQEADTTENAQSVGSVITFGSFRTVHLGDLTWNKEFELMCPNNPIGLADVFIVSHHGQPVSNSEALVHAIESRVAIMNNGTRKGGQPAAMRILHSAPRLEDLWQLHFSLLSGQEYTVPGLFIANLVDQQEAAMPVAAMPAPAAGAGTPPPPAHNGPAHWVKVSARADGSFTVTNGRNGFSKTYAATVRL